MILTIQSKTVNVIATAYNRNTTEKIMTRMETVDLTQGMWGRHDTWTKQQVKDYYESFWNDLNPESREVVYVDYIID